MNEPETYLRALGKFGDDAIDLGRAALACAALDHPEKNIGGYLAHLDDIAAALGERMGSADRDSTADAQAVCLSDTLAGRFGYSGDRHSYEDMQNADLMRVIDRRKGLPVALGILYLHAGRAQGLRLTGLNFPGHFIIRLAAAGSAVIIDPFDGGAVLEAADLRKLLRETQGEGAELRPEVYAPVSARDVLLRLQNNILGRSVQEGDWGRARDIIARMVWIAPDRAGLHYEQGNILARLDHLSAATGAFETCLKLARGAQEWRLATRAAQALDQVRARLH